MNVHTIAAICGKGSEVKITGSRAYALPILVGFTPPAMGENATAHGERTTRGVVLDNQTTMPVVIGAKAGRCQITTKGPVKREQGQGYRDASLKWRLDHPAPLS